MPGNRLWRGPGSCCEWLTVGFNTQGETETSHIAAPDCDLPNPVAPNQTCCGVDCDLAMVVNVTAGSVAVPASSPTSILLARLAIPMGTVLVEPLRQRRT